MISLGKVLLLAGLALAPFQMSDVDRRLDVAVIGFELNESAAKAALAAGANINHVNEAMGRETMLITAVKGQKAPEVFRFLLQNGADPSIRDASGKTALDYARAYRIDNTAEGRQIMALLGGPAATASPPATAGAASQAPRPATPVSRAQPARPAAPAAAAAPAGAITPGVYECHDQAANISPMSFGILDKTTYMSSAGKRGTYAYDAASGVLSLDPGRTPARFKRTGDTTFRAMRETGELAGFTCPLNKAKNPQRPPW